MQSRKHCEKRRNCLLQAISPFLTMFSTALVCQNVVLCGNGVTEILTLYQTTKIQNGPN